MNVFFSYAREDEDLLKQLETHLAILKRGDQIHTWHEREIIPGDERKGTIDRRLEAANVILLLVSPAFIASDYCWDVELERAMKHHEAGTARVIPIILRPCDWQDAPFGKLQALPRDARPVTDWPNRDQAYLDIAKGLRAAIEEELRRPAREAATCPYSARLASEPGRGSGRLHQGDQRRRRPDSGSRRRDRGQARRGRDRRRGHRRRDRSGERRRVSTAGRPETGTVMPFTEALIAQLTDTLAGTLVGASGRRLRRVLADPERERALERCCEAGIVALIRIAGSEGEVELAHLSDVIRTFFTSGEIADDLGRAVAPLLRGQPLDMGEMRELFADAGYDPETLPGFDFEGAFTAFAGGFAAAAVEQPALRDEIRTHLLFTQLELQADMRDALRELVTFLGKTKPGTAAVAADQITAENVAGTQIIFSSPVTPSRSAAPGAEEDDEAHRLRNSYLGRVMESAGFLALSGVDPAVAGSEADASLRLDAVYTALLTQAPQEIEQLAQRAAGAAESPSRPRRGAPRDMPALDQLNRHRRLVLLGDPGSGKSTFANFVALCLAGELLGDPRANLELLTAPLPHAKRGDDDETAPPAWDHGPLLPVRVILRDFAARGLPAAGEPATADSLWRFLKGELERAAIADYAPYLKQTLQRDGGLILLDGLDEVPEAEGRRRQITGAVKDFAASFSSCRFLVTCRTYAYQHQKWRLSGFSEAILDSLNEAQIRCFVDRWYAHVAQIRGLDAADAQGRAELLKSAIFGSDRLKPLAERPLLLTLMASLHAWRGGSLPDRREELYHDAVQLLLDFWEQRQVVVDASGKPIVQQESLAEWLRVDRDRVRRVLNEIAFRAHAAQPDLAGTADVAEQDLVARLMEASGNPDLKPARLVEFLRDRAGLLLARGVGVYTFPHRTFQEYLAACHLTDRDFPDRLAELARGDKERWREVALLAGAKSARGSAANPWNLADALCYRKVDNEQCTGGDVHGAHLAGLLLAEATDPTETSGRLGDKLDRVRDWQVDLLSRSELPARARAECGRTLARLGDPRRQVTSIEAMQLCWVPAAPFRMGSASDPEKTYLLPETPPGDVPLPYGYWIGRFPVTRAQFQLFIEDGGYDDGELWSEAITAGAWREGTLQVYQWDGRDVQQVEVAGPQLLGEPYSFSNHPVVGVCWFEARAFCRWLSNRLHLDGPLGESWRADLPNEPEWEKAARGGFEIPSTPIVAEARTVNTVEPESDLAANPQPNRRFPWDGQIDAERANYWHETAIGTTSAVGCFPRGRSPYGLEEMSGSVWEWTRSQRGDYPYPKTPEGRAERESFDPSASRFVLRARRFSVFSATYGNFSPHEPRRHADLQQDLRSPQLAAAGDQPLSARPSPQFHPAPARRRLRPARAPGRGQPPARQGAARPPGTRRRSSGATARLPAPGGAVAVALRWAI